MDAIKTFWTATSFLLLLVADFPLPPSPLSQKPQQPGDDPGSILTIHADPSNHARRAAAAAAGGGGAATAAAAAAATVTVTTTLPLSSSQQAPSSDLSSLDPILAQLRSLDLGAPLLGEKVGTDDPEWAALLHAASGVKEKERENVAGVSASAYSASARPPTPPSPKALPAAVASTSHSSSSQSAPGSSVRGQAAAASSTVSRRFRDWASQRSALAAQRQSLVSQRLSDADAAASRAATTIEKSRGILENAGGAAERAAEVVSELEGGEAFAKKLRASLEALAKEVEVVSSSASATAPAR